MLARRASVRFAALIRVWARVTRTPSRCSRIPVAGLVLGFEELVGMPRGLNMVKL